MKLTPKREKFALAVATGYHDDGTKKNQADAYRECFNTSKMTDKSVWELASRLMNDVKVKSRVDELKAQVANKCVVDASYVLNRLYEIDQMDVLDIHNDDGTIKPIREWPKIWRQYLSAIEVSEVMQGFGDHRQIAAILKKVKWPDKVKNLELLGKHLAVGAFVDKVDHTSSDHSMSPAKSYTPEEYAQAQAKLSKELGDLD